MVVNHWVAGWVMGVALDGIWSHGMGHSWGHTSPREVGVGKGGRGYARGRGEAMEFTSQIVDL